MGDRATFVPLVVRRRLDWCPTCRVNPYTPSEVAGLEKLLQRRPGRWFTCDCGMRWRYRSGLRLEIALATLDAALSLASHPTSAEIAQVARAEEACP